MPAEHALLVADRFRVSHEREPHLLFHLATAISRGRCRLVAPDRRHVVRGGRHRGRVARGRVQLKRPEAGVVDLAQGRREFFPVDQAGSGHPVTIFDPIGVLQVRRDQAVPGGARFGRGD